MIDPAILARQRTDAALSTRDRAAEFGLIPIGHLRRNVKDLSGKRYDSTLVLGPLGYRRHPNGRAKLHWLCRCGCGTEFHADGCHLREGTVNRCSACCHAAAARRERERWDRIRRAA